MLFESDDTACVNVEFAFVGTSFDLDYVSRLMGMQPRRSVFEKVFQGRIETSWTIEMGKMFTLDIADALSKMLETLRPLESVINQIREELDVSTVISIEVHEGPDGVPAIRFSGEVLEFFHAIHVKSVDVDLYTNGPDEDEEL